MPYPQTYASPSAVTAALLPEPPAATDLLRHDRPYLSRDVLPVGTFPMRIEHPGYDSVELFVTLEPGRVAEGDTLLFPALR